MMELSSLRRSLGHAVATILVVTGLASAQTQQPAAAGQPSAPASLSPGPLPIDAPDARASLTGTLVDSDADVVSTARLTFTSQASQAGATPPPPVEALSDKDGFFQMLNLPPGAYTLEIAASGFSPLKVRGVLNPGQDFVFPNIKLSIALVSTDVQVTQTSHEIATEQLKLEEKQRIFGVIPNYYMVYTGTAEPLSAGQKFSLAWKTAIDPTSFVFTGIVAGVEQSGNLLSGYGEGASGYAKRYASAYGDFLTGTFIGGAILPSLLRQDPRYFVKESGSIKSRVWYAIDRSVICRGDNGRKQVNYSNIGGGLAAGLVSNLYYPPENRNSFATLLDGNAIGIVSTAVGNLFQEFLIRHLTPNLPPAPKQ